MKSQIAVKPTVLSALRIEFGLSTDVVASKIKVEESELLEWEKNTSEIPVSKLKTLAAFYGCHWSVFLLDNPPKSIRKPKSFRRTNGASHSDSHDLILAYQTAQRVLGFSQELGGKKLSKKLFVQASIKNDPEIMGSTFRDALDIDLKAIGSSPNAAYTYWKEKIEASGLYVAEQDIPHDSIKAFTLREKNRAIVVVNRKDTYVVSKLFSLLHEVGHLLLGESASCEIAPAAKLTPYNSNIEMYCNHFAGAALLPKKSLEKDERLLARVENKIPLDDKFVKSLASHYKVSFSVALRRLAKCAFITPAEFKKRYEDHETEMWRLKERQRERSKDKEIKLGKEFHLKKWVDKNSASFTKEVFGLYLEQKISYGEIARYLDNTSGNVSSIKQYLGYD